MKVLCIIETGFEELEMIAPVDILRRGGVTVDIYTTNSDYCVSKNGVTVCNLLSLNNLTDNYDCLLLPGGPHYAALESNLEIISLIKRFHNANKLICCICASPTILGGIGLLRGKKYTCYPPMNKDFGGIYSDDPLVVDGNIITAKAAGASILFGLAILKRLCGSEISDGVASSIYYE